MTEAMKAIIEFGFRHMELNRIQAVCIPENIGSSRVMEKAGMKSEGILRQYAFLKGHFVDLHMHSILRSEMNR